MDWRARVGEYGRFALDTLCPAICIACDTLAPRRDDGWPLCDPCFTVLSAPVSQGCPLCGGPPVGGGDEFGWETTGNPHDWGRRHRGGRGNFRCFDCGYSPSIHGNPLRSPAGGASAQREEKVWGDIHANAWRNGEQPPFPLPPVITALAHSGPGAAVVRAFKHDQPGLAVPIARRIVAALPRQWRSGHATLVPIPPSSARVIARGFDPVAALALALADELSWTVEWHLVQRNRAAPRQTGSRRGEREANVSGLFRVDTARIRPDTTWVLLDDVVTSTATLREATAQLQACGVHPHLALAAARAQWRREGG